MHFKSNLRIMGGHFSWLPSFEGAKEGDPTKTLQFFFTKICQSEKKYSGFANLLFLQGGRGLFLFLCVR